MIINEDMSSSATCTLIPHTLQFKTPTISRFVTDLHWWDSHRNVAACCQRTKLVLCVCVLSQQVNYCIPTRSTWTHKHNHGHTHFQLILIVCSVFRFWTVTGWCCRKWRKLLKPNTHQDKVYTQRNTHIETHTSLPVLTAPPSLRQTTCLTWSSTSTRWRSCRSTVTQTESRRSAPPSAAWRTFPKSSSLPWRTWWVISQHCDVTEVWGHDTCTW